jgi:hypothetical protein
MLLDLEEIEISTRSATLDGIGERETTSIHLWMSVLAAAQTSDEGDILPCDNAQTDVESAGEWMVVWNLLDGLARGGDDIDVAVRREVLSEQVPDLLGIFAGETGGDRWSTTTTTGMDRGALIARKRDEPTETTIEEPAPQYPLLSRAIESGRITGRGLPRAGSRTLRFLDDEALPEAEQIRFGAECAVPSDHVRRPRR